MLRQRLRFREKVLTDLVVFERMLEGSRFDFTRPLMGLEIELNLLDGQTLAPAMINREVLADPPGWVTLAFDRVDDTTIEVTVSGGDKSFDFNVQQYTITDERKQGVDFSSPYYSASQSLIALKGGAADGVTDLDGLKDITIGAMANSTSGDARRAFIGRRPRAPRRAAARAA